MKNILPRNLNPCDILTFLPGFSIFQAFGQFFSSQTISATDGPENQLVMPSAVSIPAGTISFNPGNLTNGRDVFCDIIHFQCDRMYPFLHCYVYRAMKDNVI
jgi:hypothetical protein